MQRKTSSFRFFSIFLMNTRSLRPHITATASFITIFKTLPSLPPHFSAFRLKTFFEIHFFELHLFTVFWFLQNFFGRKASLVFLLRCWNWSGIFFKLNFCSLFRFNWNYSSDDDEREEKLLSRSCSFEFKRTEKLTEIIKERRSIKWLHANVSLNSVNIHYSGFGRNVEKKEMKIKFNRTNEISHSNSLSFCIHNHIAITNYPLLIFIILLTVKYFDKFLSLPYNYRIICDFPLRSIPSMLSLKLVIRYFHWHYCAFRSFWLI